MKFPSSVTAAVILIEHGRIYGGLRQVRLMWQSAGAGDLRLRRGRFVGRPAASIDEMIEARLGSGLIAEAGRRCTRQDPKVTVYA